MRVSLTFGKALKFVSKNLVIFFSTKFSLLEHVDLSILSTFSILAGLVFSLQTLLTNLFIKLLVSKFAYTLTLDNFGGQFVFSRA